MAITPCPPIERPPFPYPAFLGLSPRSMGMRLKAERRVAGRTIEMTRFKGSRAAYLDALTRFNELNQQQN
jgi:hypothetical protein